MWIFNWLLLLFGIPFILTNKRCERSSGCTCYNGNDLEYQCPSENDLNVLLRYSTNPARVVVDGHKALPFLEEENLPKVSLGKVESVKISYCGLPRKSYKTLFDRVNITETKTLIIDNIVPNGEHAVLSSALFEDLEYLEYLRISNNENIIVEDNFLTKVPKLLELNLYNSNMAVNVSALPNLRMLDMSKTKMQDIPSGNFVNLKQLKQLYLFSNNIKTLNQNSFKGADNVEMIELLNNKITQIEDGTFKHMHHLYNISLINNNITSISENTFQSHKSLYSIRLAYNKYLRLLDRAFFSMNNLTLLRLDYCNLKDLPDNTFEGSTNLKEIQLQSNQLETIPLRCFSGLEKLKKLNLGFNKLKDLPNGIFESLNSLEELNLENNALTKISLDLFKNQNRLYSLNLRNNLLSSIDKFAFTTLTNVKELDLSYNKLLLEIDPQFYIGVFSNFKDLVSLNLSHNLMESMDNIPPSVHLKTIDMSYNNIKELSLQNLQNQVFSNKVNFDFSNNNITTIDSKLVDIAITENPDWRIDINLSNNPIDCSCENYEFLKSFPEIQYAGNNFNFIDYDKLKCNDIDFKFIDIPFSKKFIVCPMESVGKTVYNCSEECECFFKPYNSSFIMNCFNKSLTEVPKFKAPEKVRVLNTNYKIENVIVKLEHNNLEESPPKNYGYENITEIYLDNNSIRNISWIPSKLKVLHLDNNYLNSLSSNFIELLNTSIIESLTLDENPWTCDCTTVQLQNYLLANPKKIETNNIRCKNSGFQIIQHRSLCKSQTVTVLATSITLVVLLLIAACLAASYYKWQEPIKVWLYSKNLFLWFVTEEELDKGKIYDVFLSFSSKDDDFVLKSLLPALESEPNPFKVCVHYRDWIPGEHITTQIINSVTDSRRTLVVLSSNFLESNWAKNEFRMAHTQALNDGRARVIVVILGDIEIAKLDDELKAYLRTNTYVKWGDPWFWQKLSYALPHHKAQKNKFSQKHANIMLKIDQKFDMVKTMPQSTPPILTLDTNILPSYPLSFVSDKIKDSCPVETNENCLIIKR
ncbi:unnamed protein product [Brassicogethes aeneus]|uniref:TIR domain-containing protein n=1 Tax=Brassicogethes aeneus TaxID=1431903 RepID=A0A9P0FHA1_BRAAE|nr:unnamed protein product [Brassicogethes aeneus]